MTNIEVLQERVRDATTALIHATGGKSFLLAFKGERSPTFIAVGRTEQIRWLVPETAPVSTGE